MAKRTRKEAYFLPLIFRVWHEHCMYSAIHSVDLNYSEVTQVKYLPCQYCFPEVSRFLILSTTSI